MLLGGHWRNPLALSGRSWFFLGLSALATALLWICSFRALKLGPASLVAPVDKLSVLVVVLLAVAFLGEAPRRWAGWRWHWWGLAVRTFPWLAEQAAGAALI